MAVPQSDHEDRKSDFSMHRARGARARVWQFTPPSLTLQLLAFDEKTNFDCFALFSYIKQNLFLYAEIKQNNQKWIFHQKPRIQYSTFLLPLKI
jgi:hypothetical protein